MTPKADAIELSEAELRDVTSFAAACARTALGFFEEAHPSDLRPREAIEAAEAFAGGGRRGAALRTTAWAAHRAARETASPAAQDAARAAAHAAGSAYLHPLADAHQVKHVLGAAAHAARALELAGGDDCAVGEREVERARRDAPPGVRTALSKLPPAPAGGGRMGELMRRLDLTLRG
ncbi:putative immunity protein [Kineococcus esterisolvens]|uniref:putative immunity protein n=1 Tax=unclassified Kineococcus TaxID=2621656 RepID=UPI003D7C4E9F